ncbi:MAG: hypothetical protein LBU32_33435 [Clostridiales bacterium]|nr:hypothetical protein [Clostridiales bacterium]
MPETPNIVNSWGFIDMYASKAIREDKEGFENLIDDKAWTIYVNSAIFFASLLESKKEKLSVSIGFIISNYNAMHYSK